MTLLKGRKIAQPGQTGGENAVHDATAAITASEATSQYSRIPASLQAKRIWLPFKTSPRPASGVNKIPHSRQGRPAKYTDPSTWMSYEEAVLQRLRPGYAGIGIVFSEELGILGSDFDHCIVDSVLRSRGRGLDSRAGNLYRAELLRRRIARPRVRPTPLEGQPQQQGGNVQIGRAHV